MAAGKHLLFLGHKVDPGRTPENPILKEDLNDLFPEPVPFVDIGIEGTVRLDNVRNLKFLAVKGRHRSVEHINGMNVHDVDVRNFPPQCPCQRQRGPPESWMLNREISDAYPLMLNNTIGRYGQFTIAILVGRINANFVAKPRLCTSHFQTCLRWATISRRKIRNDVQDFQAEPMTLHRNVCRHDAPTADILAPHRKICYPLPTLESGC